MPQHACPEDAVSEPASPNSSRLSLKGRKWLLLDRSSYSMRMAARCLTRPRLRPLAVLLATAVVTTLTVTEAPAVRAAAGPPPGGYTTEQPIGTLLGGPYSCEGLPRARVWEPEPPRFCGGSVKYRGAEVRVGVVPHISNGYQWMGYPWHHGYLRIDGGHDSDLSSPAMAVCVRHRNEYEGAPAPTGVRGWPGHAWPRGDGRTGRLAGSNLGSTNGDQPLEYWWVVSLGAAWQWNWPGPNEWCPPTDPGPPVAKIRHTAAQMLGKRPNQANVADPVDTASGNFWHQESDLAAADSAYGLDWTRTYNARGDGMFELGRGWSGAFSERITAEMDGSAVIRHADGRVVSYPVAASGSGFVRPPGERADLVREPSGAWRLDWMNGERWTFNAAGWLATKTNWDGTSATATRVSRGQLTAITSSTGPSLSFAYGSDGLASVTASDGRKVTYAYSGGRLVSATTLSGGTTTYGWDAGGRIAAITDATGVNVVTNTYDDQGPGADTGRRRRNVSDDVRLRRPQRGDPGRRHRIWPGPDLHP